MKQWNSDGETVWCNSGTVVVEQCNGTVEKWNSERGIVGWNSGTVMVKLCGGTVGQWDSGTVKVE